MEDVEVLGRGFFNGSLGKFTYLENIMYRLFKATVAGFRGKVDGN